MKRREEMKKIMKAIKTSMAFILLSFMIMPTPVHSTDVTIESDTFIRCLIGQCETPSPFGSVRGTDLGTFASDPDPLGFTYIFFGDTDRSPDETYGKKDAYLKVPNDRLRAFITQTTLSGADMTEFAGYLQSEFADPFDYPYRWVDLESGGFYVPTGAFFSTWDGMYYIYYVLDMDGYLPDNNDASILLQSHFDILPLFPWDEVVVDPSWTGNPWTWFFSRTGRAACSIMYAVPVFDGGRLQKMHCS